MRLRSSVTLGVLLFLGLSALPVAELGAASVEEILTPASGKVLFVAPSGKNQNDGSQSSPLKNLDKAIAKAAAGDTIVVAEGTYSGTFAIGYFEADKPLSLYGGFAADFSERDPRRFPTYLQPDNASAKKSRKPILTFTGSVADGVVVDGFVFDMGSRNAYHPTDGKPEGVESGMLVLPPGGPSGQAPTVEQPCLYLKGTTDAGAVLIANNVFANCASFGIQAGLRGGTTTVRNNVFVANRMAAIEIFGTCANETSRSGKGGMSRCGEIEIDHNTILFTWSRQKDFLDMGYGIRIMTRAGYAIHHNLVALSILSGIDHTRFTPDDWIRIDDNLFFGNKQNDLEYSPASNTKLNLDADQFGDLEIQSAVGNVNQMVKLPVDPGYLAAFLAARYSETTDYDPNSQANQLRELFGLDKQGTISSQVTLFGNRYPASEALALFGGHADRGAQASF